ncbi:MAG: hypothetical protein Q9219_001191 [cf. Caloplaca sp. 3 TL-2023]
MAYNDDAVKAKLSSLNETQESIVSVSQWIMFHRRHADRTCAIWLERMRETTINKRLTLIYLANEVVQQSKARRKDDFLVAFSPVIAEATATAYKGATNDVQEKIRRTVEVWSQRRIFDKPIQEAVEARIAELDKSRSGKKSGLLGNSLTGGSGFSAPIDLQPLVPLSVAVSRASALSMPTTSTASDEYAKLTDPDKTAPTPPVHAARLSALLKSLASAEGAVVEGIMARQKLIQGIEALLAANRTLIDKDNTQLESIRERREIIERKKREVEDAIMRGASTSETPSPATEENGQQQHLNGPATGDSMEPERPNVEELTPPPPEPLTPTDSPNFQGLDPTPPAGSHHPSAQANEQMLQRSFHDDPRPTLTSPPLTKPNIPPTRPNDPRLGSASSGGGPGPGPTKKRKLDEEFEGFGADEEDAMARLDEDVAELLRAESRGVVQ